MSYIIQMPDDPNCDTSLANFCGWGGADLSAGQFVIIQCQGSGRKYLGQVTAPQVNLNRDALAPFDNTTINQLEAVGERRFNRDVVVKEVFHYKVRLLKDVTEGIPRSVRKRPQITSLGRAATEDETISFLGLPPIVEEMRLGSIIDTDIAVCTSVRTMMHHMLVAGSTGSGKTNTIANIVTSAASAGACVIVYDHKPDYQNIHERNDDGDEPFYRAMPDVQYWRLGSDRGNASERDIVVPASELDHAVLAATIFHHPNEHNQSEAVESLLSMFAGMNNGQWSIERFANWIPSSPKRCEEDLGRVIDAKTLNAIRDKIRRPARIPSWVDGKVSQSTRSFFGGSSFDIQKLVDPGRVVVVRIDSSAGNGRGYGLFLSYILRQAYRLQEASAKFPIVHVIDEAQDIFNAGRSFQNAVGGMLDNNIRKGRSRKIGFVIGVQSADAVPESIRNNLNSQFIHRHNNHSQAKEAMTRASPEQIAMTDTFGPGECLAYIFGSNAVIHCQMRRSPFRLTKEGA